MLGHYLAAQVTSASVAGKGLIALLACNDFGRMEYRRDDKFLKKNQ